ncbi:hypothetical protein CEP51_016731 [Fusarium floridanum]|uniref:AttH domain-containing protein n=1 Tax=Fusarium floridanum TaxID=1325733 RepID=A0A428NH71_9HYPO|nr:hypothetical protein CEP51_016731 [Fusarium floridanum]
MRASSSILLSTCGMATALLGSESYLFPAGQVHAPTEADSRVGLRAFDGPHINANNGSAYQWWYFDAVAKDSSAAVVAQFYPGWFPESNGVLLNLVWPNGSTYYEVIPAGALQLTTVGDSSQGYADDAAMTWFGSSDLSTYHVTLNLPQVGVSGKITLQSKASPRVAGGLKRPGASFDFAPFLYWANTIPDSNVTVDLVVNGTNLSFTGAGYHDQNWGLANFAHRLTQWYWGHTSVGNYSLVFFYHLDESQNVTSSAFLAENGKPLATGFSNTKVTPQGPNVSVPVKARADIESWIIEVEDLKRRKYVFTLENKVASATDAEVYQRWVGITTGGQVGGLNSTGPAIVELMHNPELVLVA